MGQSADSMPVEVSLLALPETTPAAVLGLLEVFSAVGVAWAQLTGEQTDVRRIRARIVADDGKPFRTATGVWITPHASLSRAARPDIVIVSDLSLAVDVDPRGLWPRQARWIRRRFEQGAIVCSACTGSLLLAEAGLLDGREATTHWSAAGIFRQYYPRVQLRPERILCAAGSGHRVITGGGSSSWEDLALYLIARFCGEAEAVRIAKIFVLGDRSEGQLPFAAMSRPRRHEDAVIGECQRWIAVHYAMSAPVARMVARSGLTERTFKRRFKAATGFTPVEYVQTLRIEEAKHLLETTGKPTEAVGRTVGYEDPAFFRRLFKRRTGVTPARYRQRFGGGIYRVGASR